MPLLAVEHRGEVEYLDLEQDRAFVTQRRQLAQIALANTVSAVCAILQKGHTWADVIQGRLTRSVRRLIRHGCVVRCPWIA
jgi:hypothetical protein